MVYCLGMRGDSKQLTKGQVTKAGEFLRAHHEGKITPELSDALDIVGLWRESHVYPLQQAYMRLKQRALRVDSEATNSQRLKRIPSILDKLHRQPEMQLARMQDLGGCRAIVKTVYEVRQIAKKYEGCRLFDYIENPKPDGYRGVHIIHKFQPTLEKHAQIAGRLIEIQVRSRLQHAWATAIETVDSLLKQKLKLGGGDPQWRRFFALSSSVMAILEKSPIVPGLPSDPQMIREELVEIDRELRAIKKLEGLSVSIRNLHRDMPQRSDIGAHVLILDLKKHRIDNNMYERDDIQHSLDDYLMFEKQTYGDPSKQVVHVYVDKVKELKKAYPNYFLNASSFVTLIRAFLKQRPRGPEA